MPKLTYTFTCKLCGKEGYVNLNEDTLKIPVVNKLPDNWCQFFDGYVCDNHMITITDKEIIEE
jgi:hypothetical protein